MCNIVALPVATVVALPETRQVERQRQGMMDFLAKQQVRLFGLQFSHGTDIPDISSGAKVLAWEPYLSDGAKEYVAPAILCAVGNIASVRRLYEPGDNTTWAVRTQSESPADQPLSRCPNLTATLQATSTAVATVMQVLPGSKQKEPKVRHPEVMKLMAFLGNTSRRGDQRFQKKDAKKDARKGNGKGKANKSRKQGDDSQHSARGNEPVS